MKNDIRTKQYNKFNRMSIKVVYNDNFGGYGISDEAVILYRKFREEDGLSPICEGEMELISKAIKSDDKYMNKVTELLNLDNDEIKSTDNILSEKAINMYRKFREDNHLPFYELQSFYLSEHIERHDPYLVKVIEILGNKANDFNASLTIDIIPEEYKNCYEIFKYDGNETVVISPKNLVYYNLKMTDVSKLSDLEKIEFLEKIKALVK